MGVILWPAALLLFLVWSLAAWIIFGLSDWAAGQVAGAVGGLLAAELGPWAAWAINSLGTVIKFGIVAVWAIVGFVILGAPLWLRKKRHAGQIPDAYTRGYPLRGTSHGTRSFDPRDDDDAFEEKSRRHSNRSNPWRDREAWQQRTRQGYGEASFLRDEILTMMGRYGRKKRKKRDDDDD
jgi:hypothetical protein